MPEMNGHQFLSAKRRIPKFQDIPVIVLSAWTREWTGAKLDAFEVLSKPVELDRLREIIASVCNASPAQKQSDRAKGDDETGVMARS